MDTLYINGLIPCTTVLLGFNTNTSTRNPDRIKNNYYSSIDLEVSDNRAERKLNGSKKNMRMFGSVRGESTTGSRNESCEISIFLNDQYIFFVKPLFLTWIHMEAYSSRSSGPKGLWSATNTQFCGPSFLCSHDSPA